MTLSLDETDFRILRAMQVNAEASVREIADGVGLSQAPCWRRIDRMRAEGVIKGRALILDRKKLGYDFVAFIRVKLNSYRDEDLKKFEKRAIEMPEVQEAQLLSAESTYRLRVVTRSVSDYEDFFRTRLSTLPSIQDIETTIVVSESKFVTALPI